MVPEAPREFYILEALLGTALCRLLIVTTRPELLPGLQVPAVQPEWVELVARGPAVPKAQQARLSSEELFMLAEWSGEMTVSRF